MSSAGTNTVPELWPTNDPDGQSLTPNKTRHYKFNPDLLVTSILCLVFVVALILVVHLYARYVLRRQQRRRRAAIVHFRTGITPTTQLTQTQEQPTVGLEPSVIAALPRLAYKSTTGPDGSAAAPDCAVCLSTVEEGEMVRIMPNCKHTFHEECIDMWLHSHSTCPVCRAEAAPSTVVVEVVDGQVEASAVELSNCGGGALERRGSCREESSTSSAARLGASLRRMLSRGMSSRRQDGVDDLERQ